MVLDATSLEVCECYILILIAVFFYLRTLHYLKVRASFRITQGTTSATAVRSIDFARRGEYLP